MKKYIIIKSILLVSCLLSLSHVAFAQRGSKSINIPFETVIVDSEGRPVPRAEVLVFDGTISYFTDAQGKVSGVSALDDSILIEADGYEEKMVYIGSGLPETIVLTSIVKMSDSKFATLRMDGGYTTQSANVGANSSISGAELLSFPTLALTNALSGKLSGLRTTLTNEGLGLDGSILNVRGLHRNETNEPLVIVDGFERDMDALVAEEVEKVEVLKDATAKILYGARGANGVIVVTTRRGDPHKKGMHLTLESGAMITGRTPDYLDSWQYAALYNEARTNDGLSRLYSDARIEGYRNSAGANDLLFPNVDYYDYFTKKQSLYRKATFDIYGGNDRIRYSGLVSYTGGSGFERMKPSDYNKITMRANLDVKITDFMKAVVNSTARLEKWAYGGVQPTDFYTRLNEMRPNEFPLTVEPEMLGVRPNDDGTPFFGASTDIRDNLLADMQYGGLSEQRQMTTLADIGLLFDMDKYVKGLSFGGYLSIDNYSMFTEGMTNVYPTYALLNGNSEAPEFMQMRKLSLVSTVSRKGYRTTQNLGYRAHLAYERTFGKHYFGARAYYNYYKQEVPDKHQNIVNNVTSVRLNWSYADRYIVEGTYALFGSNRFAKQNRFFSAYSAGVAWVLTNEPFFDVDGIDYFKVKASYGRLGYDVATDHLLYNTSWGDGVDLLDDLSKKSYRSTVFVRYGNPDLKWESSDEINVGIESAFLDSRLKLNADYFREIRDNIIGRDVAKYVNVVGNFIPAENIGTVMNHGVDMSVSFGDRVHDFSYNVRANFIWSENLLQKWSEVNYPDKEMMTVGKPTDNISGYEALGLFGRDVALEGHPKQFFGNYQNGDIAYLDFNEDEVVDNRDVRSLGNSVPRYSAGLDVELSYKGLALYVSGVADFGVSQMINIPYYINCGDNKFSAEALKRYHPENNPGGIYPRLTSTDAANNSVDSSFWLRNASFFRLKNVELSYTFDFKTWCRKMKVFARGTDVFFAGQEKNLYPETINSGLTNQMPYMTITGGLSFTF